jgi:hypothetical protein
VVLQHAATLLRVGNGRFDAYPPQYASALAAYGKVRAMVATFEAQPQSVRICATCKQRSRLSQTRLTPSPARRAEPTRTTPPSSRNEPGFARSEKLKIPEIRGHYSPDPNIARARG